MNIGIGVHAKVTSIIGIRTGPVFNSRRIRQSISEIVRTFDIHCSMCVPGIPRGIH